MIIKQVQTTWKPKWKKFQPPKWFIFRWAYKIDINATVYDGDKIACEVPIQQCGVENKNGRIYSKRLIMKQVSRSNNANQVQIGIVNNYYEEEKEED